MKSTPHRRKRSPSSCRFCARQRLREVMVEGLRAVVPDVRVAVQLVVTKCGSKHADRVRAATGKRIRWAAFALDVGQNEPPELAGAVQATTGKPTDERMSR